MLQSASPLVLLGVSGLPHDYLLAREPLPVLTLLELQWDHNPSPQLAFTCETSEGILEVMNNDEGPCVGWGFIVELSVAFGPHPQ
jgi:hypothetical protein